MSALVFLIEQLATGFYILIGVGLFVHARNWMRARDEYRSAGFELVRDEARYKQTNAITVIIVLLQAALVLFGIQQVVAPAVRAANNTNQTLTEVVEDLPFATFTPAPPISDLGIDPRNVNLFPTNPADIIFATPTLTPTPVGTIMPNAPPVAGCESQQAFLQIPANGMRVFAPISVVGSADVPNFAYYKLEISGPSTLGQYAVLAQLASPVREIGGLGQFVPAAYEYGRYEFRLTVFDITNTLRATCMVNIYITEPPSAPIVDGQ